MREERGQTEGRVRYYRSFTEDFVQTANQAKTVDEHYRFVHANPFYRLLSHLLYGCGFLIALVYCRFALHLKVVNRARFPKDRKQGYFVYANHTQPFGDVVMPFLENPSRRKYWIGSSANLGIPLAGRLLPMWGILPVPSSVGQMHAFEDAVAQRVREGCGIYVYPEAHVWPWYTGIRPFAPVSFTYPVKLDAPVYVATTTYQRRRFGKRPRTTVYLEGPVGDNTGLTRRERKQALCDGVASLMQACAAKESRYAYVTYLPAEEKDDGTALLR